MSETPLFIPRPDGTYDIQPAGVMILFAQDIYENQTMHVKGKLMTFVELLLNEAARNGFKQRDILETLLFTGQYHKRTQDLARAACKAIGDERLAEIIAQFKAK